MYPRSSSGSVRLTYLQLEKGLEYAAAVPLEKGQVLQRRPGRSSRTAETVPYSYAKPHMHTRRIIVAEKDNASQFSFTKKESKFRVSCMYCMYICLVVCEQSCTCAPLPVSRCPADSTRGPGLCRPAAATAGRSGDFLAVVERVQEVGLLVDLRRAGEKHLRRCKRTASSIHTHTYINKT